MKKHREPLRVVVIEDDELNSFERKTVRFGYWGVVIGALSLTAACVAAFLVFQQFKEMSAQTELLNRGARQARSDSAANSLVVAKQLFIAQQQARTAIQSVKAIKDQTEIVERPWVSVDAVPSGGLGWFNQQPNFAAQLTIKNVGKSVAKDVRVVGELVPVDVSSGDFANDAVKRQREICEKPEIYTHARTDLFPGGVPFEVGLGISATFEKVAPKVTTYTDITLRHVVGFYVVGCVSYYASFSPNMHQTFFGFYLVRGNGVSSPDPLYNRLHVLGFEVGANIPQKDIQANGDVRLRSDAT